MSDNLPEGQRESFLQAPAFGAIPAAGRADAAQTGPTQRLQTPATANGPEQWFGDSFQRFVLSDLDTKITMLNEVATDERTSVERGHIHDLIQAYTTIRDRGETRGTQSLATEASDDAAPAPEPWSEQRGQVIYIVWATWNPDSEYESWDQLIDLCESRTAAESCIERARQSGNYDADVALMIEERALLTDLQHTATEAA